MGKPDVDVLIVDDLQEWSGLLETLIKSSLEMTCNVAQDYQSAINLLSTHTYSLVIVDLSLSGASAGELGSDKAGIDLLEFIRQESENKNCGVIVLTGYDSSLLTRNVLISHRADDYIVKDEFNADRFIDLARNVIHSYRIRQMGQFSDVLKPDNYCVLTFTVSKKRLNYRFEGAYEALENGGKLKLSRDEYNSKIAFFGSVIYSHHYLWLNTPADSQERILEEHQHEEKRKDWRGQAKMMGKEFYQRLFDRALSKKKQDLHRRWGRAIGAVNGNEEKLVLRFNGPADNLALPFELLHDGDEALVLRHPMSRQISRTLNLGKHSWREFLRLSCDKGNTVRALLIATEKEALPEIEKVAQQLEAFAQRTNIKLRIDLSDRSSPLAIGQVREELKKKQHHLIHFVGHARFNEEYPELSFLGTPRDIDEEHINAAELHDLLLGSPTQFLYLSCCSGAEMGKPDRGNAHWGLLHAAINAGVSASLGFRWWVRMDSACRFAEAFYKNLDDSPFSLERAAFRARKEIGKDGWNETWFSPILVIQKPEPADSINK